jgi:hypothetical protein
MPKTTIKTVHALETGAKSQFSSWGTTLTHSGFTEKFWGTSI